MWSQNIEVSWVLVGREGWSGQPELQRQDILSLIKSLESHPEKGKRLFWMNELHDDQLAQLYAHADCLLNASLGEGLGLPLLEAARHGLPLLLRDLPVFKEVAGTNATYFNANSSEALASAIEKWTHSLETQKPDVANIQTITWNESKSQVLNALGLCS